MAAPTVPTVVVCDEHELTALAIGALVQHELGLPVASCRFGDLAATFRPPDSVLAVFDMAQHLDAPLTKPDRHIRLLAYSAFAYDQHVEAALALGCRAYVLKTSPLPTFLAAVEAVRMGEVYFDPTISHRLIAKASAPSKDPAQAFTTRRTLLSKREWEVLALVADGLACKDIARRLHISTKTVDRHRANLMAKLAIHSQLGLACYALAERAPASCSDD